MTSADRQPVRVVIHGSCVSRDTYARLPAGRFALVDYVARQSLITAAAPGPGALQYYLEDVLTSRFQRRVTRSSLVGDLDDRIRAVADSIDVLLWDITDERLGVYAMPGGGFVTRTVELIASGADSLVAQHGRLIEFGTDEHLALWAPAMTRWLEVLAGLRLDERLLLVRAPWAEVSETGAGSPSSFGVAAADFNAAADRYYRFVADTAPGVTVVSPRARLRSSPDNVWGDAPFHYDEPSYEALALAVGAGVDDPGSALAVPQPVVVETSPRVVLVSTAVTWGAAFALHVTRRGDRVVRLPYQRDPAFAVDLPDAGRYGFRVFHRSADGDLVATATASARLSR